MDRTQTLLKYTLRDPVSAGHLTSIEDYISDIEDTDGVDDYNLDINNLIIEQIDILNNRDGDSP